MSIAASVIVRPSPLLRMLVAASACGAIAIGLLIAAGQIGGLAPIPRVVLGTTCIFLGFFGFYHGVRHRKHQHIDISGTGQIRLVEARGTGPCSADDRPYLKKNGEVVHLLPDSTLWRQMLLLRLRTGNGEIVTVPVLRDSVSQEGFRTLSVSCRWILGRSNTAGDSAA